MFIVILSSILGLMHFFIWKRMVKDTTSPGRTRWVLSVALVALALLLVATLILPRALDVPAAAWLAWPGYLWFGLAAYLFLVLLALEPVRFLARKWADRRARHTVGAVVDSGAHEPVTPGDGTGEPEPATTSDLSRRIFIARTSAAVAGAASLGITGVGVATALGPPDVLQVPVRLRRLDPQFNGFRIAVVSDIHLGPLAGRAHTERIVRMINETEPDLVAIVGDLVDGSVEQLGSAAEPLRDLVSREGSFFVTGNHEYFVDDTAEWLRELERFGVQPMLNESTAIRRGSAAFDLVGVNDIAGEERSAPPDFDRALAGTDPNRATVLLAHQPVQVTEAAARGVDLQLSGHTHGGQMWPFHYIVGLVQPSVAGLSRVDDTQLYVSRGAGFWGPPLRVGAPPDISVLSLQSAE